MHDAASWIHIIVLIDQPLTKVLYFTYMNQHQFLCIMTKFSQSINNVLLSNECGEFSSENGIFII